MKFVHAEQDDTFHSNAKVNKVSSFQLLIF